MTPHITIRTAHERPRAVAEAVRPDNTDEMTTEVVDGAVETTIERPDAASLRATADDYLKNLAVAERAATPGNDGSAGRPDDAP